MSRKIIIAVTAAVLIGAITLLAAQKAKKKESTEAIAKQVKAVEETPANPVETKTKGLKCGKGLLNELKAAYEANDREKMGQIIQKMEQRREKMKKFAKFERWHKFAHHRMEGRGYGRHHGLCSPEPRWQRPGCPCPSCRKDGFGPPAREYRHIKPWRECPSGDRKCPLGPRGPGKCPMKDLAPGDKPATEPDKQD